MKRFIIIISCICVCIASSAQTPVEKVISKYADVRGAKDLIASGGKMILARSLIRKTPLAAIAPDVDVLEVLKMQNAPTAAIKDFEKDFNAALKSYEYYGRTQGNNGLVDIYITMSDDDIIDELVIYNPEIYSVNSLKGSMRKTQLLEIFAAFEEKK